MILADVDGIEGYEQLMTFTTYPDTRSAILSISTADAAMLGVYSVTIIEEYSSTIFHSTTFVISVEIEPCQPNFSPPEVNEKYEYVIGRDQSLIIEFSNANNGNCFFESTMEFDTSSEDAFFFRPEILVENMQQQSQFSIILDAQLKISTEDVTLAGTHSFTYIMESITNEKEIIKIDVEFTVFEGLIDDDTASNSTAS